LLDGLTVSKRASMAAAAMDSWKMAACSGWFCVWFELLVLLQLQAAVGDRGILSGHAVGGCATHLVLQLAGVTFDGWGLRLAVARV
jgi:hypothetical protein